MPSFYDEIKALKTVQHPGLIPILDASSELSEDHFYVMEYIDGLRPLCDVMKEQGNPYFGLPLTSLDAYLQILRALKACHDAKVVHRDVSHKNVMVAKDKQIKLIDFGLCHLHDSDHCTSAGEHVGTHGFRAPECDGYDDSNDPRTDHLT